MTAVETEMELLEKTKVEYAHPKANHSLTKSPIRLIFSFSIGRVVLITWRHRIAFIYSAIQQSNRLLIPCKQFDWIHRAPEAKLSAYY